MASIPSNIQDALVQAGVSDQAAAAIARGIERPTGPSPTGILAAATALGFAVLTFAMGWLLLEIHANRTLIEANRDRIDAVGERVTATETRLSDRLSTFETSVSERLTRIETLLEERLPARR